MQIISPLSTEKDNEQDGPDKSKFWQAVAHQGEDAGQDEELLAHQGDEEGGEVEDAGGGEVATQEFFEKQHHRENWSIF